jgi:hypothetical protein
MSVSPNGATFLDLGFPPNKKTSRQRLRQRVKDIGFAPVPPPIEIGANTTKSAYADWLTSPRRRTLHHQQRRIEREVSSRLCASRQRF